MKRYAPLVRGRAKKLVSVADLVTRVLAKRHGHGGHEREAIAMKIFGAFARIGAPLTEHAEPVMFRGGVLTLAITDSAWLTELTFLKPEILERLNRGFSKTVVKDLRFRLGTIKKREVEKKLPPLSPEAKAKVDAWTATIADDAVRAAVIAAAAKSLAAGPRKARFIEGPSGPMRSAPIPEPPKPEAKIERDRWASDRDRWKR